jgi:hypothetical protein
MAPLTSIIEIARPQAEVFSYVTDPSTFGEWQAGVVGGSIEGEKPAAVGSKCTTTRRVGGAEREATSELTKLDPPASWAVRGIDGPIRAIVNVNVEPLNGGLHSRVTIELDFDGTASASCSCHSSSAARHATKCQRTAAGSSNASSRVGQRV